MLILHMHESMRPTIVKMLRWFWLMEPKPDKHYDTAYLKDCPQNLIVTNESSIIITWKLLMK
jgi:hypothetical protein